MNTSARLASIARNPSTWAAILTAAIATFIAGRLALLMPVEGGPGNIQTVMWAPIGITFALAWRGGFPSLVGATLGVFICSLGLLSGHPLFALIAALFNVLPAAYARWQLRRNGIEDIFSSPRGVVQFAVFVLFIAPLAGSSLGAFDHLLEVSSPVQSQFSTWLALSIAAANGMLLVAPVLLCLRDWRSANGRWHELLGIVLCALLLWWEIFIQHPQLIATPLTALIMPLLLLAAFRFEFGIVASINLLMAVLALISFSQSAPGSDQKYIFAVAYLAGLSLSNLAVGAGAAALRNAFGKLSASEELLRGMFDKAAVGLLFYDLKTNARTFNAKFCDMLGYSVEEITQSDLRSISSADDQQLTQERALQMQRGEIDSFNQEKRYTRKSGETIWVSLTMSILRDKQGAPTYLIGVFEDITSRKRTEKQLEGQTRILEALAAGTTLSELLNDLAVFAEELWPGSRCAILLTDGKGENLQLSAVPGCAEPTTQSTAALGGDPATEAAISRRDVICADLLSDEKFTALRSIVEAQPWRRAWWAIPFTAANGELLGVLNFYFESPRAPSARDSEFIAILGSLAGIVVQHHRDEDKLRDSEKRFRITFEQAAVGVALLDRDSQWLQVNQKFCDIVGYTHDELLALRYDKLIAPEDIEHTLQTFLELQRESASQVQIDHRYMRKNGDSIWVNSQFSVARGDDGEIDYQIVVIKDITQRKRAEAEVERIALYDYLTGLPNRRLFGDRLRTAVMAAKRSARFGAVIYIDLDNFKQLNDTHGHNTGDDFLKMVAQRLQQNLREEDTVARLGGDEFVILLQNVSNSLEETATATAAIAAKVQSALSESFLLPSGIEHIVTSSLGITLFPKDEENAEDLLKEADIAMYRVKESRRNAMRFYEPAMKAEVDSRLALERALRRALHNDEFELYLQPQYDVDRHMVSCEALLRWPQPDGGFISPNEFVPIAEDTGLIVPLGEWVLRRAAKLAHALERAGHFISICVNVSPRQFGEANFVERVGVILSEMDTDASRVVLEITEGVVVADFEDVRSKMLALRRMGIRLSIDDFGTGHSSLAYLKLLPLHELKIDRAFIHSLPGDANDVAIVEAVLSVARHLQFEVVAEGVESIEQFEFLKQRGCHRFQGYLLARPAPPEQHFATLDMALITRPSREQ